MKKIPAKFKKRSVQKYMRSCAVTVDGQTNERTDGWTETCMPKSPMLKQVRQKWHMHPAKTQISLCIRPIWSESSHCTQWIAEDPMFLYADREDSDKTLQMLRLMSVFAGRKGYFVGFVVWRLIYFLIEISYNISSSNRKLVFEIWDILSQLNFTKQGYLLNIFSV